MREHNLKTGDWVKLSSTHNTIIVPVAEMASLNENTEVWTWNAIGKERGLGTRPKCTRSNKRVFAKSSYS